MAENGTLKSVRDQTLVHTWVLEPKTEGVLTKAGLENIAEHKYVSGRYTHLDNLLNPIWTYLTNLLPMWLAPNMVTTFGGMHCGLSYAILWYYSPNFDQPTPDWVVLLSGYCTIAYYTLDCMDGKQARRTGASSPLGQLFDHGFDCICNLAHASNVAAFLVLGDTHWYLAMQTSLQFAFFMAQWEEYYTHILPHATGDWVGVTEVNYTMGLVAMILSMVDREACFIRPLSAVLPSALSASLPSVLANLELRYVSISIWIFMLLTLISLSIIRVAKYVKSVPVFLSAVSKLLSPFLLMVSSFLLPSMVFESHARYCSVAAGLLFSLITKKMIVFSMAKMAFAAIQLEVLPFVLLCIWIRCDTNITKEGATLFLGIMCCWSAYRLTRWAGTAIDQICKRLDIYCLTIKKKTKAA
jgi:ethanolaminephosphotransferase